MLKKMLWMGLISLTTLPTYAAENALLSTRDKSCSFYYITQKNTQGWYIDVSPEMCKNGLVNGQGAVTIYNAFSKPAEQIYGFFNAGFWTGDKPLSAPILGQTTEPDGTQKVFFSVPNKTSVPAEFIGQMTAERQKDASYTPFSFCAPFRILVKTTDVTLFQNQQETSKLVDSVVEQIHTFCPAEQFVLLYASSALRPTPNDIFFYAELDLKTARINVKKNGAFDMTKPVTDFDLAETNVDVFVPEVPLLPDDLSDLSILEETPVTDVTQIIVPVQKTEEDVALLPQEIPALLDKVPHLLLAGQVLQKPVLGAAIVHIKSSQGNTAVADAPAALSLVGEDLKEGWGIVSGTFTAPNVVNAKGRVQVSSFVSCLQERCQELEGKNE